MHLFAGIGGGLLADKILGHEPIIAVEWDGYCCQVLRERAADGWFPGLRVWEGDVRMFDPSEYAGKVDCIHAGFPCQDISVAGNQAGVGHETRSGLYREVLRIAGIVRPRYLFLENVSAILSNGLGTVLADLATMGFAAEWGCIRASDCGAPHHRDRWWCLATNADSQQRSASGMGQDSGTNWRNDSSRLREVLANSRYTGVCERGQFADVVEDVRLGNGICSNGVSRSRDEKGEVLAVADSAQRQGNERTERIESEYANTSVGSWWTTESNVDRVDNEFSNGVHGCSGIQKEEVNERQIRKETSATQDSVGGACVSEVREGGTDSPSSSRLQQTSGCGDSVRQLPRETTRNGEMGRTPENEGMPSLPEGISIQESEGDLLQFVMCEQVGMGKSWFEVEPNIGRVSTGTPHRIHRLKGLGNAQVPLQAAVAWKLLGGE